MNNKLVISGFSDEACENFQEQLNFVSALGIDHIEIRGVDGRNISELAADEIITVKKKLDSAGVKISSIGSPIGKIMITDAFEPHFELFKNVVSTAKTLGTNHIRIFSFYIPDGEKASDYRDEVISRLSRLIAYAKANGIILLHENEKGIYGDNAQRCLDLMKNLYCENFKAVFDFANFVQINQDTIPAFDLLEPYVTYIHIKDAIGMNVVPAGFGEGNVKEILRRFFDNGYSGYLSLEPHLTDFSGFASLESSGDESAKQHDGKFWWRLALNSLKAILFDLEHDQ